MLLSLSKAWACTDTSQLFTDGEFKVEVIEFSDPAKTYQKLVLIIPPTGGMNFIDRSYANQLCENGIKATVMKSWTGDDEYNLELEIHQRFYNRAQKAIELSINHYQNYELGILGTSVGGIHAAIATSRFDRLKSSFLIVSGGNIASIISNTTQKVLVDAKEKRFKKYHLKTIDEYEKALSAILPYEPLMLPIDASKRLGMIISENDDVVPTKNQQALREHWNPQYGWTTTWGHTLAVVKTWLFDSADVVGFFLQTQDLRELPNIVKKSSN